MRVDEAAACNDSGGVDWWAGAAEEDSALSLPLEGDGGLWEGAFVPPPPRPAFLDSAAVPDGLTTCDLCAWAFRARPPAFPAEATEDSETRLGWLLTLAIVSIVSAAVGAVIMVTVLHCRNRLKTLSLGGVCSQAPSARTESGGDAELVTRGISVGGAKDALATPAENHYTLHEEALYAELDRESARAALAAYQNTAYTGSDGDASAPSSAYYSDLSAPERERDRDRTYEAVAAPAPAWDRQLPPVTETVTVPSDYV